MKKILVYLAFIIVCSGLIIYAFGFIGKQHQGKNSFNRKFISPKIELIHEIELPDHLFGFVGKSNNQIILKNYSDQLHLFKISDSLEKLDTMALKYPSSFNITTNIYKDFQEPNIYVSNPYSDIAIYNGQTFTSYKVDSFRFDNFWAISPTSLIVRAHHNYDQQKNRALAKVSLSKKAVVSKIYPLPKSMNGFFTNDGFMFYDKSNARILYMYFYRGEFLCLDTNLNLKYKGKTIDTVQTTQIKTGVITTKTNKGQTVRQITPITPPFFVNKYFTTDNSKIYFISALKADNETRSEFHKNQPIDVYSLLNGQYLYSFYIPKYKGQSLNELQIKNETIVAIFGTHMVSYSFKANIH